MNKRLLTMMCVALLSGNATCAWAQQNEKPFVIPELVNWDASNGVCKLSGRILLSSKSSEVKRIGALFAEDFNHMLNISWKAYEQKKAKSGDIVLALDGDASLGEEGYKLEVGEYVKVSAYKPKGLYWATRTILQMSEGAPNGLPKGKTIDKPQYALRGFMLDVGRKYIPMSYLRKLIKVLSYYKVNTLQLHLNDNGFKQYFGGDWAKTSAAFRLESTTFPGLAAKGASYTKQEFIDLQKEAEALGVEIIPEIDVPAHCLAFTHYKPELASKDCDTDHLDIFKSETYEFIDALFKEYLSGKSPVFRGKRVNIGTDEYSNATEELREKFRSFADHYIRYVESFGKQVCIWSSFKHSYGKTPIKLNNVIAYAWSHDYDTADGIKKNGAKIVSIPDRYTYIVPATGYYYDYLDTKLIYDKWTPAVVDGYTRLSEQDSAVLGGMFAVWNDHYGNGISTKDIHHRIMPALQYMSLKMWTAGKTTVPYQTMEANRLKLSEAPDVNELARWGSSNSLVLSLPKLASDTKMLQAQSEIGYDYTVSFKITPSEEDKGTVLMDGDNAQFYLSDPKTGRLGFARDGYLNTFSYRLKPGQAVELAIEGDNKATYLYVNGRLVETLYKQELYAKPQDMEELRLDAQWNSPDEFKPEVYRTPNRGRMYYIRTLVFPLKATGHFKSEITDFKVYNYRKSTQP